MGKLQLYTFGFDLTLCRRWSGSFAVERLYDDSVGGRLLQVTEKMLILTGG